MSETVEFIKQEHLIKLKFFGTTDTLDWKMSIQQVSKIAEKEQVNLVLVDTRELSSTPSAGEFFEFVANLPNNFTYAIVVTEALEQELYKDMGHNTDDQGDKNLLQPVSMDKDKVVHPFDDYEKAVKWLNSQRTENITEEPPETLSPINGTRRRRKSSVLIGILFYLAIGLIWVSNSDSAQQFLINNQWPLLIMGIVTLAVLVIAWVQKGVLTATAKHQIALLIFVAIPILLVLVGMVSLIRAEYQVALLRSVFLLIVCMLPATMYYLFIASRKSSLLQEYHTNLSRLGLFGRQTLFNDSSKPTNFESELVRRVRIMSYIQKFEAVYGPIPSKLATDILHATDPDNRSPKVPAFHNYSTSGAMGGIFTPETAIPVVFATLLIGLGWLLVLPPWQTVNLPENATIIQMLTLVLQPGEIAVNFAFLGAYFFSLQMLFRRYVRKDLRSNAYMAVSLRIILAVIGIWAVLQAATILEFTEQANGGEHQALLVIGFVIGAFPPIAWQVIQAAFRIVTGARFFVPSLRAEMPVSNLDGLTVWHQARLEEEDIENVPNMATADLVELMLNTRVPPERIVDWVDQAMLYTQLGPDKVQPGKNKSKNVVPITDRKRLRMHGIRTASALVSAYRKSKKHRDIDQFESILPSEGRMRIRSLVDTLSIYPNLQLVQNWRHQTESLQVPNAQLQTRMPMQFRMDKGSSSQSLEYDVGNKP